MLRLNFFKSDLYTESGIGCLLFNKRLNVLSLQSTVTIFCGVLLLLLLLSSNTLISSLPYEDSSLDYGSSFVVDIGVGIDTLLLYSSPIFISNLVDFYPVFLLQLLSLLTKVNSWLGIPVRISLLWFCFDSVLNKIFLGSIEWVVFTSARLIAIESFTYDNFD